MTGYLKKHLEPLIYENKHVIGKLIEKQVCKFFPNSYVTCKSWGFFSITVHAADRKALLVEKKLRQILGVKVTYAYTGTVTERLNSINDIMNPKYGEVGSYHYRLHWRDL